MKRHDALLLTAAVAVAALMASVPVQVQTPAATTGAYSPPRLADGKPDLEGIWQARNTAYADLEDHPARLLGAKASARLFYPAGLSVVEGKTIPYKPEALAKKQQNFKNQETADPMAKCYLAGVPRLMYLPVPLQITQTSKYISIIPEYTHNWRQIYVDGSRHIEDVEFWMGDSRGRWDGDTLVIDTTNFNDETWFDMVGNYHSNGLHVVERVTRVEPDVLQYEATIEDSQVFTRPWKISMALYRVKPVDRPELFEYECADLLLESAGKLVNPSEDPPAR